MRLTEAYSHLGWEPPLYLEIYDEDDTADYSQLLKRIGHGPASGRFSVSICVYDIARSPSFPRIVTRHPRLLPNTTG